VHLIAAHALTCSSCSEFRRSQQQALGLRHLDEGRGNPGATLGLNEPQHKMGRQAAERNRAAAFSSGAVIRITGGSTDLSANKL